MSCKQQGWVAALCLALQSSLSTRDGVNRQPTQYTHGDPCRDEAFFSICPDSYTAVQGQAITHPSVKGSGSFLRIPELSAPAQKYMMCDFFSQLKATLMLQSFSCGWLGKGAHF